MPDPTNLPGSVGSNERLEAILLRSDQVMTWLAAGYTLKQIAERLGISPARAAQIKKRYEMDLWKNCAIAID